jgi:BCD family chlorophyll transporter-like MFS transporter
MEKHLTRKRLQLALVHAAVAMTLVPIQSTLNRVMIKELAIAATLVALFASLPYLFSPIQVAIGSFSDRHPLWGLRRTPYILLGLLMCVAGVGLSPYAAFALTSSREAGLALSVLAFGAWGMGFNFATVSYFSLASELSGEKGRSRTMAVMFFVMIVGIIFTAIGLSRLLEPYSPETLARAFGTVALAALALGLLGVAGLESRARPAPAPRDENPAWSDIFRALTGNPQARLFFVYLILMLSALLGQDILLEPFAAQAFGMSVQQTTRITSIWGTCTLICLIVAGALEGRTGKRTLAKVGGWGAAAAFAAMVISGVVGSSGLFYLGVVLLGLATGLATVSNLSLMLDMTTADKVGLFIGAWGMANALARLVGNLLSGVVRDLVTGLARDPLSGYLVVFGVEAAMLVASLILLRQIDVGAFRRHAEPPSVVERMALASES